MAHQLWQSGDPIGKRIKLGGLATPSPWMTVIGVVADMKRYALTETPRPEMIVPYTQKPYPSFRSMQFVVRSSRPLGPLVADVRHALAAIDPTVPVSRVRTVDDLIGQTSATARFAARFMGGLGATALLLALVGVYSVVAYSVYQRRQEFGIRRALGAGTGAITSLVLRDAVGLTVIGLVLGVGLSAVAGRLLRHSLYQISPFDLAAIGVTVGLLAIGTIAACLTPAWRATRIDPRIVMDDA
jgi:ABC-type antimicrobial peptide transport system permease subunit